MELESGRCPSPDLFVAIVALACVDGALAFVAFSQAVRIHLRNPEAGWTRQIVLHLMIGSSNLGNQSLYSIEAIAFVLLTTFILLKGCTLSNWSKLRCWHEKAGEFQSPQLYLSCCWPYVSRGIRGLFVFFISAIVASCMSWSCWSYMCGFIFMACPEVLFLAAFLLLLSFWVDLCHQANDDEYDEDDSKEKSYRRTLLEKSRDKKDSSYAERRLSCCSFQNIEIESRQKFVIVVVALIFILMASFAVAIRIGKGEGPIDSKTVAQAYVDIFAVTVILLGGALGCYGTLLFLKLRKVRSERASAEMWKVAGLAAVSVVCFTSNASVALLAQTPLFYSWDLFKRKGMKLPVLLLLYYFIGSSVPSAALLWVIRELPRPNRFRAQGEQAAATVISYVPTVVHHPKTWVAATSATNQVHRVSPI